MKKLLSIILGAVFCISGITILAADTADTVVTLRINDPIMTVNGADKEIDPGMGTVPVIINDRTLLPVRAVVEELGGTVGWDGEVNTVTLEHEGSEILLTIDSLTAYLNGAPQTLDTAPVIINDRTMLPIRFIAESFNFDVQWDSAAQVVTITKSVQPAETAVPTEAPTTEPSVSQTPDATDSPSEQEESTTLVVYFSNTGNTENIAKYIAEDLGADMYEIEAAQPYTSADLDYNNSSSRANMEQNDDSARPEIANGVDNMEQYDVIYLGYPIWWGQAPKIIYTFLESYDFSDKTIIPFCTSGSSGIGSSASNLHSVVDSSVDWNDGRRFSGSASSDSVADWINEITE